MTTKDCQPEHQQSSINGNQVTTNSKCPQKIASLSISKNATMVIVGESAVFVIPAVYLIPASNAPIVKPHLHSPSNEVIAIIQRLDRIGPFVSKTLRKESFWQSAPVKVRLSGPTGTSRFSLEIYSFLRETLLLKGCRTFATF